MLRYSEARCDGCFFWRRGFRASAAGRPWVTTDKDLAPLTHGDCRIRAPKVMADAPNDWAMTYADDGCAEHSAFQKGANHA